MPQYPSSLSQSSSSASISSDKKNLWSSQRRNPMSLRLYKVLGTNFDDETTKEALYTLSDLYAQPPHSKGPDTTQQDPDDLDEVRAIDPHDTYQAFLEPVRGESASQARKNLRRDMENKLVEGSGQFLKVLGELDQRLAELQQHVSAMVNSCDEAEVQLNLTTDASKALLERAGSLREERHEVEKKWSIILLFLRQFTLRDDEFEALTSRDVAIGQRFFEAMDRTEKIRNDCRVLMAGEDGPTKAGLDMMASTSSNLEKGYEKIFRWCSHEFRQLGRETQLEVSATMREAVQRLQRRPELLTEILAFLSETRQATFLSSFTTALTRGGPSGLPRPIELHAHDPMRYVGDMLAWVHQNIAAEQEFLQSLFGLTNDGRMVGSTRVFDGKSAEEDWVRELMDSAVKKLCMPLKIRVQQTIRSQESSIVSYKIANLLQFYMLTMRRTIGERALLSTTLQEITDVAYKVFYDSIQAHSQTLLQVPPDLNDQYLNPPLAILDYAQILREIMAVHQSSLLDEGENEHPGFQTILDIMVDPAIETCLTTSKENSLAVPRWDKTVYTLNCLAYLQSVLEPFAFTQEKHHKIQDIIDTQVSLLTDEHYINVIIDAGLSKIVEACEARQGNEPLSRIPQTQPSELQAALRTFSLWLSGPEVVQSHRLSQLIGPRLHIQVHHAALERVVQAYKLVCEEVRKPENKYEAASTLLGSERPFGQVHLLWQIFGLDETQSH